MTETTWYDCLHGWLSPVRACVTKLLDEYRDSEVRIEDRKSLMLACLRTVASFSMT